MCALLGYCGGVEVLLVKLLSFVRDDTLGTIDCFVQCNAYPMIFLSQFCKLSL